MPKERIHKSGINGYADLLVQWGPKELALNDPRVRLFIITSDAHPGVPRGAFMFHPDKDQELDPSWQDVESVGPVDIMLDRVQVNRLIRTLRRARDGAFGADA